MSTSGTFCGFSELFRVLERPPFSKDRVGVSETITAQGDGRRAAWAGTELGLGGRRLSLPCPVGREALVAAGCRRWTLGHAFPAGAAGLAGAVWGPWCSLPGWLLAGPRTG